MTDAIIRQIQVREIEADEFYAAYGDTANNLVGYYMRKTLYKSVLSAFIEGRPAGYAVYDVESRDCSLIKYIYIKERYRRRGVAKRLLYEAERKSLNENRPKMKLCLLENIPEFNNVNHLLISGGYAIKDKVFLFRGNTGDYKNWQDFMESRGNRLMKWLESRGYAAESFDSSGEELMNALRLTPQSDYRNKLDIGSFLRGERGAVVGSMSYIAYKKGDSAIPASYCLVTSPDEKSVIFDQISVAQKYINTGVILYPFAMAMKRFGEMGFQRAVYAIYENDVSAISFANRFLARITSHRSTQYNYIKVLSGGNGHGGKNKS
jgi:GNAT superfamily N-acetyltransferase